VTVLARDRPVGRKRARTVVLTPRTGTGTSSPRPLRPCRAQPKSPALRVVRPCGEHRSGGCGTHKVPSTWRGLVTSTRRVRGSMVTFGYKSVHACDVGP
jgi:hypothetical protein